MGKGIMDVVEINWCYKIFILWVGKEIKVVIGC